MGKASSSKKVARAAGIGGGRTSRGKTPVLWYSSLVLVAVLGIGLTTFSRDQRLAELGSSTSKEAPQAGKDHWHVALGVRDCDRWLSNVADETDNKGIHSHADGLIHVEPGVAAVAGRRATFDRYAEAVKGKLADGSFAWPESGGKAKKVVKRTTGDKCGQDEAEVKTFYNGEPFEGDPGAIRLTDQGKLVMAFVKKGTTYAEIGEPPSVTALAKQGTANPAGAEQSQLVDPTVTSEPVSPSTPETPAAGDPPTSTAPPSSAP